MCMHGQCVCLPPNMQFLEIAHTERCRRKPEPRPSFHSDCRLFTFAQRESVCLPGAPPEKLLAKQLQSLQLPAWVLWVHLSTAISPDVLCYVSSIIPKRKDNGGDLNPRRPRSFRR